MKKLIIAAALLFPLTAFAGEHNHGESDRGKDGHHRGSGPRMEHVIETLDLNDTQKEQIAVIFSEHREKMKGLREETENKVHAILTAEQQSKLDEMKEKRREKRKERRDQRGHTDD